MLCAYYLIGGSYWIHHCASNHSTTRATYSFQSIILPFAQHENIDLKNVQKYRTAGAPTASDTYCWRPSLQERYNLSRLPLSHITPLEDKELGKRTRSSCSLAIQTCNTTWRMIPARWTPQQIHTTNCCVNPWEYRSAFCSLSAGISSQLLRTDLQQGF